MVNENAAFINQMSQDLTASEVAAGALQGSTNRIRESSPESFEERPQWGPQFQEALNHVDAYRRRRRRIGFLLEQLSKLEQASRRGPTQSDALSALQSLDEALESICLSAAERSLEVVAVSTAYSRTKARQLRLEGF